MLVLQKPHTTRRFWTVGGMLELCMQPLLAPMTIGIGCMQLSVADRCLLQMMRCETTCSNCLALVFSLGGKKNIRSD